MGDPGHPRGRKIFLRADLNVPLDGKTVRDDTRLRASLGTLQRLLDAGARVVLASHLGRPGGKPEPDLSLAPVATALSELIKNPVHFATDCVGECAESSVAKLADGEVLLLENLRFHSGEVDNDREFARALARLADAYVNDAFGTAHRTHASTVGIVDHLTEAVAGDLLRGELENLRVVLEPERPLLCLLGGAKVSDKLGVLRTLAEHADVLAIGGAMAYTFLAARGQGVGESPVQTELMEESRGVLKAARQSHCRLLLPTDHVVTASLESTSENRVVQEIPDGWMAVDVGPKTATAYAREAETASTILWNGPMGIFEIEAFAAGTCAIARALAASPATTVVGGGDSLAAINQLGIGNRINHLSTGGGAALEFVQGLPLPAVTALEGRCAH
ncbi:MAG: phosphoglycerate kinase [Myxococcota bacterium]